MDNSAAEAGTPEFLRHAEPGRKKKKSWASYLVVPGKRKRNKRPPPDPGDDVPDLGTFFESATTTHTRPRHPSFGAGSSSNSPIVASAPSGISTATPPLKTSPGPSVTFSPDSPRPSVVSNLTYQGEHDVHDFGAAVAEQQPKKKKTLIQKVFGTGSSSKNKSSLNSESLAKLSDTTAPSLRTEDGRRVSMPPLPGKAASAFSLPPQSGVPVTPDESWEVIRTETREDCLHMLSLIQRRFFIRLAQEEDRLQTLQQKNRRVIREAGLDENEIPLPVGLSSGITGLTQLVLKGEELGSLQQVAANIDWTKVDTGPQGDALRALFVIHSIRNVVETLFERDGFREVVATLHTAQAELMEEFCSPSGCLGLGSLAIQALTNRIESVEKWHVEVATGQARAMAAELDNLRSRLRAAVSAAFASVTGPVTVEGSNSPLSKLERRIVMPRFLTDTLVLHDVPDSPVTKEEALTESDILALKAAAALKHKARPLRKPTGAGFNVSCGRAEFAAAERVLNGRWGSYRLFESWLKDATRWQWLDLNCQLEFNARQHDLDRLVADKEKEVFVALDQKLTQLWQGRALHYRYQNALSLRALLEEAATSRTPVIGGEAWQTREEAQMTSEDVAAQWREFLDSKAIRSALKHTRDKKHGDVDGKPLRSVEDVDLLAKELNRLHFSLMRDATLVEEIRLQQEYEAFKKKVHDLRKHVDAVTEANKKQTESADKKKSKYEIEHQELMAKLEIQTQKQQAADAAILDAADWKTQVEQLQKDYQETKKRTAELEKEKTKAKANRKQKEAEAAALRKHIAAENKKHEELQAQIKKQQEKAARPSKSSTGGMWKLLGGGRKSSKKDTASAPPAPDDTQFMLETEIAPYYPKRQSVIIPKLHTPISPYPEIRTIPPRSPTPKREESPPRIQSPLPPLQAPYRPLTSVPLPPTPLQPTVEPPPSTSSSMAAVSGPLPEEDWQLGALEGIWEDPLRITPKPSPRVMEDLDLYQPAPLTAAAVEALSLQSEGHSRYNRTPSSSSYAASDLPHLGVRVTRTPSMAKSEGGGGKKKRSMFSRMKKAGGRVLGISKKKSSKTDTKSDTRSELNVEINAMDV